MFARSKPSNNCAWLRSGEDESVINIPLIFPAFGADPVFGADPAFGAVPRGANPVLGAKVNLLQSET